MKSDVVIDMGESDACELTNTTNNLRHRNNIANSDTANTRPSRFRIALASDPIGSYSKKFLGSANFSSSITSVFKCITPGTMQDGVIGSFAVGFGIGMLSLTGMYLYDSIYGYWVPSFLPVFAVNMFCASLCGITTATAATFAYVVGESVSTISSSVGVTATVVTAIATGLALAYPVDPILTTSLSIASLGFLFFNKHQVEKHQAKFEETIGISKFNPVQHV